ncbi:MAG: ATP-binding protein [Tannerella sp.]|jgi:predicted AAA+ superfamily ATPase|nr:ATP-binding protein [Tannerella sp.]
MCRKYLTRNIDRYLSVWKQSANRKPLLLHGARLAGKTSAVRELARQFEYFVEINFENDDLETHVKNLFKRGMAPRQICRELSRIYDTPVVPRHTLLFFDEIQRCLPAFTLLSRFFSDCPELHVVAAGSLLPPALKALSAFGIGCIRSRYIYPFSFEEYLRATDRHCLADALRDASPGKPFPADVHAQYADPLARFILAGGMPAVVATCAGGGSWAECQQALDDSIRALCDDFSKYRHRMLTGRLYEVFTSVARQTGSKFNYSKASRDSNHPQIKECIRLLEQAGFIYPVVHTSAATFPLAAGTNAKFRKYIVMDTGIYHRLLQLDLEQTFASGGLAHAAGSASAELFVGLEMLKAAPDDRPVPLYYWQDERLNSQAEMEYVVQRQTDIVPVEVVAGPESGRQHMHRFLSEKGYARGIRCSPENFGIHRHVTNYPLYAAARIVE